MKSRWNTYFSSIKQAQITDIDFDDQNDICNLYKIGNILPVMIVLNEKKEEVLRIVGEKSLKELHLLLDEVLE
jgi:hypothetical protein